MSAGGKVRPTCLAPICKARSQAKRVPTRASLGPYSVAAAAKTPGREERERGEELPFAIIPARENFLLRLQVEIQARASATLGGTSLEEGVETRAEAPERVRLSSIFF